jgi:hypothetical protein
MYVLISSMSSCSPDPNFHNKQVLQIWFIVPLAFARYIIPFSTRGTDYAPQIFKPSAISGPGTKSVQTAKSQPYAHFGNWKMCHVLHEILVSGTVVNPLLMPF